MENDLGWEKLKMILLGAVTALIVYNLLYK